MSNARYRSLIGVIMKLNYGLIGCVLLCIAFWALVVYIAFGECPTPTAAPGDVFGRSGDECYARIVVDATGVYHGTVCDATRGVHSVASAKLERAVKVPICRECVSLGLFVSQPQCWSATGVQ